MPCCNNLVSELGFVMSDHRLERQNLSLIPSYYGLVMKQDFMVNIDQWKRTWKGDSRPLKQ
jgi:hypothetical protein